MIERYTSKPIEDIFSDRNKVNLWQKTELAAIEARMKLGLIDWNIGKAIIGVLKSRPIDIEWWLERESAVSHDLNAFLDERLRHLPPEHHQYFHLGMTSYDTEESAFSMMILQATDVVIPAIDKVEVALAELAKRYRFTPMLGVTHGQWAELQSFGKRCLTWLIGVRMAHDHLERSIHDIKSSKLSGAIGSYGGITPEIEKEALAILGFKPFYGATQIMPRQIFLPLALALVEIVGALGKIALDIRLGARSVNPIFREPFGKKQKGSSAMPHKKNTIVTEQMEGMLRMAKGYMLMIMDNIITWEERAIEQSSVERVAWPDLFHVVMRSIGNMNKVIVGLDVYPDNMLREIHWSRGTYASSAAKEFLKEIGHRYGLSHEDAYRILQLASFDVFDDNLSSRLNKVSPKSPGQACKLLKRFKDFIKNRPAEVFDIEGIICSADLRPSLQLAITPEEVEKWNGILRKIFESDENLKKWHELFLIERHLEHESTLFERIIGE